MPQFTALLNESGYSQVIAHSYIFGGIGLYWATKK
jgi:hypothetical protein